MFHVEVNSFGRRRCHSVFRYPHALAQVTASVARHGERQQLVFQCEKARISAPFSVDAAVSKSNGFPEKMRHWKKPSRRVMMGMKRCRTRPMWDKFTMCSRPLRRASRPR